MARFNVGEVFIDKAVVGGVDVSKNLYHASFDESLFVPGIRGVLEVVQAQGMESLLGTTIGSAPAMISFRSDRGPKRVYKMTVSTTSGEPVVNQKTRRIVIELVSDHLLKSKGTNYQKSYHAQPTQISNMVQSIVSDGLMGLGFKGPVNVSKTIGLSNMLLESQSPIEAIDLLRNYAVSSTQGDAFTAFSAIGASGIEEFFFKPFSELLQNMSNVVITEKDFIEINHSLDPMGELFRNVIDFKTEGTSDSANKGESVYQANFFDILTGKYIINPLKSLMDQQKANPSANPGKARNSDSKGLLSSKKGSAARTFLKRNDQPDNQLDKTYGGGRSVLGADTSSTTHARIPGDSSINAGMCVFYKKKENTQSIPSRDGMNAGKQLVAAVSHEIGPPNETPRYTTVVSMMNIAPKGGM
jgi:hypothetical protein